MHCFCRALNTRDITSYISFLLYQSLFFRNEIMLVTEKIIDCLFSKLNSLKRMYILVGEI